MKATWVSTDGWMDKENVIPTPPSLYTGRLFNNNSDWNPIICDNTSQLGEPEVLYAKWNMSETERHILN